MEPADEGSSTASISDLRFQKILSGMKQAKSVPGHPCP